MPCLVERARRRRPDRLPLRRLVGRCGYAGILRRGVLRGCCTTRNLARLHVPVRAFFHDARVRLQRAVVDALRDDVGRVGSLAAVRGVDEVAHVQNPIRCNFWRVVFVLARTQK
jgi:hypothetical protein